MRVATLNLRNTADRWPQRRGLLVRQLVDLAPDVIGVQELRMLPDQAKWVIRVAAERSDGRLRYRCYRRGKTGRLGLWEGIGVLSRMPVVATAWLDLGSQGRVAQRVTVRPPAGGLLDVYNLHLGLGGEVLRAAQAQRLLDWMAARPPLPAVVVGDFNARPGSPTVDLLLTQLRSSHLEVHGAEPARTALGGAGAVLDYVFVNRLLDVHDARLAFDEPDPVDVTLLASDHYGLVADVAATSATRGRWSLPAP